MQAYLNEHVPLLGVVVGVLALVVGISTSTLMVAIAVLFCVYFVGTSIYLAVIAAFFIRPVSLGWVALAVGAALATAYVVPGVASESQTSYGAAQTGATATFLILFVSYAFFSWRSYVTSHKSCLECANTVHSAARICHHCGYRWLPPLPASESQPD